MSELPKPQPTDQGWPRRASLALAAKSKALESSLKLPERVLPSEDAVPEPPRPTPPAIKLPAKLTHPTESPVPAGKFVEPAGKPQEFVGEAPKVELAPDDAPELRSFQLQFQGAKRRLRRPWLIWTHAAAALAALLLGYGFGTGRGGTAAGLAGSANRINAASLSAPTADEQRDLDAAFTALRSPRFAEAQPMFDALVQKHPQWGFLRMQTALAALYANDAATFEKIITQGENNGEISPADGRSLLGQRSMDTKAFEDADHYLGQSVGADPTRAETYYFWGDCLLRWGRPNEAVEKFHAARLRNPNPMMDHIYLARLWLAEIESGLETTDGSGAQIDQALAAERPTSAALLAGAARAIKAGQFDRAAEDLTRAREISDPATFRVMLQDPFFYDQRWRPEFAALSAGSPKVQTPPAAGRPPE